MATKIRLTRLGGHRRPFYRIVVIDSHNARDGRSVEELGYYDPLAPKDQVKLDAERVKLWLERGAKPSVTVGRILKKMSIV